MLSEINQHIVSDYTISMKGYSECPVEYETASKNKMAA